MASTLVSLTDEFTYLVKQVKFQLPNVEDYVGSIFDELSAEEDDAMEQKLEGIIGDVKGAMVNYATTCQREKTSFKRYVCGFCMPNKFRQLDVDFEEIRSKYSLEKNAAGESSRGNRNDHRVAAVGVGEGEEEEYLSHRGRQLLEWMRSSSDYDETEDDTIIIGLEQDINSLKTRLLDNKNKNQNHLSVISVFGIHGIGKTVLARKVYYNKSSDVFSCKAWVCVSSDVGIEEILKDIGKQVDPKKEMTDDHEGFQTKLRNFLENKRFLIVIDDVPGTKVWKELKKAFPDGNVGSRVMITTRDVEVAYLADSDNSPHRLWVLSAADSWELFIKTTCHNMKLSIPAELEAIGRKMVKKCKGIPLLIVALADVVSRTPLNVMEWLSLLQGADMRLMGDKSHKWFNLSGFLDKMISSHVKQGLPYLRGLFPTDFEIPARRFALTWAAEGLFFGQEHGALAEEEVAQDCLQQLLHFDIIKTRKVSSNGNAKTCSIPLDLPMRGVLTTTSACSNSTRDRHRRVWFHNPYLQQQQQQQTGNADPPENAPIFSIWCFNFPAGIDAGQRVGHFLERRISIDGVGLQLLGVLDLEGVFKPCLPEAIGGLINLRYLGLRDTQLNTLPSNVGELLKLQTLDTKHTYIRKYPRSIQKLKKLQHLYVNKEHSGDLVSRLGNLSGLRTLSGVVVHKKDLIMKDGISGLTNLRKLRFTSCQFSSQVNDWLKKLKDLRSLKVRFKDNKNQPGDKLDLSENKELANLYLLGRLNVDLSNFPKYLTTLTLSGSELTEDPMPVLGELRKLQFLRLLSKSCKFQKMECSSGKFRQLRVLRIWKLEELEELKVEKGAMPNIEELELRNCEHMRELSRIPETLNELKLIKMPETFTNKFVHLKGVVIALRHDSLLPAGMDLWIDFR